MLKYWAKKVAQKLEFALKSDNERPIKKKEKETEKQQEKVRDTKRKGKHITGQI